MPKLNHYPMPNPDGTDADVRVEVGWSGGGVTVRSAKLVPGADPEREYLDGPPGELHETWEGPRVGFNRNDVNALIRSLRHARDQAFGPDE